MKKIFILLIICSVLILVGCKTNNDSQKTLLNEKMHFDKGYIIGDILELQDNNIMLNETYFDINNRTINQTVKDEILSWANKNSEIGILLNKDIKFNCIKNANNLKVDFSISPDTSDKYQIIKINLLSLFNTEQSALSVDFKQLQFSFFNNDKLLIKGYFTLITKSVDKTISKTYLENGEIISEQNLTSKNNTSGIFILPKINDSVYYYTNFISTLHNQLNTNVHYLYYPGFNNTSKLADNFKISDLCLWLKRVINHYGYSSFGLIGIGEGHLLMRKFAGENALKREYDSSFYLSINPVSEQGLKIRDNNKVFLNKQELLEIDEIKNLHHLITTKDKTTIAIQLESNDLFNKSDDTTKLKIVQEFSNKSSYLDLLHCFNSLNFQGFDTNNGYQNYQEHIDNRYSFKKGKLSADYYKKLKEETEHIYHNYDHLMADQRIEEMEAEPYLSKNNYLEEDDKGTFYFKPNIKDGFIYVVSKNYLESNPLDFFEQNLKSFNDLLFTSDLFGIESISKIIKKLKNLGEEDPYYYLTNNTLLENLITLHFLNNDELNKFYTIIKGETNRFFRLSFLFNSRIKNVFNNISTCYEKEVFLNSLDIDTFDKSIKVLKGTYMESSYEYLKTKSDDDSRKIYLTKFNNCYKDITNSIIKIDDLFLSLKNKINLF